MRNHLEASIFREVEGLDHCLDRMASVGVPGDVLENALHTHLHPGAAVNQHVIDVLFQTVVGPGLNGDSNALGFALLRVGDGFIHR